MSASSPTRSPSASPSSQSGSLSSPCCADEVPTDRRNMSPRSSAGSAAGLRPPTDRTPSPGATGGRDRGPADRTPTHRDLDDDDEDVRMSEDEEDEIDVTSTADDNTTSGSCGLTPSANDCSSSLDDEYFKPIKKLCMVQPRMRAPVAPPPPPPPQPSGPGGPATTKPLTSFFIKDILSHKPPSTTRCRTNNHHTTHNGSHNHVSAAVAAAVAAHAAAAAAAAAEPRGIVRPWDCGSSSVGRRRPRSADDDSRSEKSAESDSPESPAGSLTLNGASGGHGGGNAGNANSSPLDALFEMTSKAFEGLEANEKSSDGSRDHLNLFSNRQQPKKKRKSRTAFTNHQIFELEKRFLYQKYLSPADRDEIAQSLGLTNAQVITWFQNRRAKLKRDMEELKKDVDATTKVVHTTLQVPAILENIQDLSLLKKDNPPPHLLHKAKQI